MAIPIRTIIFVLTAILPGGLLLLAAAYLAPRLLQRLPFATVAGSRVSPSGGTHDDNEPKNHPDPIEP